jgi:hypothetical protein
MTVAAAAEEASREWDGDQLEVIGGAATRRLIVDAGPGTGKTAVACARIAHLVNVCGLAPARIWMISFTRTAVGEIRSRLNGYVGPAAAGIKVATVDSQAWALHSGFDAKASLTGNYEANIAAVLKLIRTDVDVAEYLAEVEHLVIDEAQDLVGIRADLIEALIGRLSPECGITVFADEAQAIYDWSEEKAPGPGEAEASLLQRLRNDPGLNFGAAHLHTVHRTRSESLREIFSDVRSAVLAARHSAAGIFTTVRDRIHSLADATGLEASDLGIDKLPPGTLILFRRRAETLMASQFCHAPHSLRLSGFPRSLPPWISACFGNCDQRHVDKPQFLHLWNTVAVAAHDPAASADDAWDRLFSLAGDSGESIDLQRLRQVLGRSNPPVELLDPDFGLPGPILGTVHASKGREADDVLLMMGKSPEFENEEDEHAETRVLFVGSTRARSTLKVGRAISKPGRALDSGRACKLMIRKGVASAMIEIGCEDDIAVERLVGTRSPLEQAAGAQQLLLEHACGVLPLELLRVPEADWNYRLTSPEGHKPIAMLPPWFRDDLWEAANRAASITGRKQKPPGRIKYLKALGSRSIVVAPDDPRLEQLHAPWRRSGFVLAPRLAAFGYAML